MASQVFLFGPLCFVLKVWTQKCSQTFLYWLSVLTIFSKISISDILFPGVLKWFPVAFSKCLFTTCPYVLQICLEGSSLSPLCTGYMVGHFLHPTQNTTFLLLQLTSCVISCVYWVAAAFTLLPVLTKGQVGHPLHLDIPGSGLFGLRGTQWGTLALISFCLI